MSVTTTNEVDQDIYFLQVDEKGQINLLQDLDRLKQELYAEKYGANPISGLAPSIS